jgi:hypothetical protein
MVQENRDVLLPLLQQIPRCEKVNDDDIQEWMEKDEQQEPTYNDIIALVNQDDNEDNYAGTGLGLDETERMSHTQGEATATDVMLLRRWSDLAARTRSKASITRFLNKIFCVLPYCILNVAFN